MRAMLPPLQNVASSATCAPSGLVAHDLFPAPMPDTLNSMTVAADDSLVDCANLMADAADRVEASVHRIERIMGREETLDVVVAQIELWQRETFGYGGGPEGCIAHLRKELDELAKEPRSREEWSGIIFLALQGMWRSGHDVRAALRENLSKCQARAWQAPDADGVVEHVRDAEVNDGLGEFAEAIAEPGVTIPDGEGYVGTMISRAFGRTNHGSAVPL